MPQQSTKPDIATAEDIVAQVETGARDPDGFQGKLIAGICILWSLYQLFIASGQASVISSAIGIDFANYIIGTQSRFIHLGFGLLLATLAYPLLKNSPRGHIPWYDWLLAGLGVTACLYLVVLKDFIGDRSGAWLFEDIVISSIGVLVLLVCTYRALGLPLVIVCLVFLSFVFLAGYSEWISDLFNFRGKDFKAISVFWMQTEGVFGTPIGVSVSTIFLFVLFGALLEKVGAGNWFVKVAVALLGSFRGGPAKAAVLSSAFTGMISGSSIANTVTTGTFTIPLMRRMGFSAEKAGAVEVASSTNGQLSPPVMGAAAFLIMEYVGLSYIEVMKHAFLPALISYMALLYIVHLEALKLGLKGLEKPGRKMTLALLGILLLTGYLSISILTGAILFTREVIEIIWPGYSYIVLIGLLGVAYVFLVDVSSKYPDVEIDDPNSQVVSAPRLTPTFLSGLYFALPIVILIWNLVVEFYTPATSAVYAILALLFIAITHHPLKALFRKQDHQREGFIQGWHEVVSGMIGGARNMIAIAVATGAAGIIAGALKITGMQWVIVDVVEFLSGGNLVILLLLVAFTSLILGMGLPTTVNYLIVSLLLAGVIVEVGQNNGLFVPLIAVHLFVFYFGILADDTPPVGLAAYAAAAISGGDAIKTGVQGFMYDIRTAILPFMFIFNTDLLLIGVDLVDDSGNYTFFSVMEGLGQGFGIFIISAIAMLLFAAATQGYFIARSRLWETAVLVLIVFMLFRPNFWMDKLYPPLTEIEPKDAVSAIAKAPENTKLRLHLTGPSGKTEGKIVNKIIRVDTGKAGSAEDRLREQGLELTIEDKHVKLEQPLGGPHLKIGTDFDFFNDEIPVKVTKLQVKVENLPPKELIFIPAFLLLLMIILIQRRRATQPPF